jgi:hypothetical protein
MVESSAFMALLDVIEVASKAPVSEADYHDVVQCIRDVDAMREGGELLSGVEESILRARGWGKYNPFVRPVERIRFGMVFCETGNPGVTANIQTLRRELQADCKAQAERKTA